MNTALTKKKKIGYGFGILTESLIYNMFYTYYLTFLIEIAGIKPAYSSIIIFLSIAWDAITDPMVGNYADKPGVDKRKMMKLSIVPLALVFILAWTAFGAGFSSQLAKVIVYTLITMCIWIFYTFYTISYYAVVAELTEDYDERTNIRSISSLINASAVGLGNILPALVPTVMIYVGKNSSYAVIAVIVSILAIIGGFVCVKSLGGVYTPRQAAGNEPQITLLDTVKTYGGIMKLKPTKWFLIFVFFFLASTSMIQSNLTYMVVDCIGMEYDTGIAIVIISLVVFMALTVPIVEKIAVKTDRRITSIIFLTFTAAGEVVCKLIGLDASIGGFKIMAIICPALLGIAIGTFWTFFYPMGYDLVELDEYVTGKRKESAITALPQLVQKFGSAFGIFMVGQLLTAYGYNKSADIAGQESLIKAVTDKAIIGGMENISTVIPAAGLVISLIALIIFPMNRKRFNILTEKLAAKRKGEEVSDEGLEKLL